jgi:hypothetical protein
MGNRNGQLPATNQLKSIKSGKLEIIFMIQNGIPA